MLSHKSSSNTLILCEEKAPPASLEARFSYAFCPQVTARLTSFPVVKISPDSTGKEIFKIIRETVPGIEKVIVVLWPETVLSKEGAQLLINLTQKETLVGPVFNQSQNTSQHAALPWPYFDIPTFCEAANFLATEKGASCFETSSLDPACFACHLEDIKALGKAPLKDLLYSRKKKLVAEGALVHVFREATSGERPELLKLIPKGTKRVLEIGCGEGGFGKLLKKKKPEISIEAVEPALYLAFKANPWYEKIYLSSFEEAQLPKNSYDLVMLGDVLEHFYDPWEALQKIKNILRPGGYLAGSVPNVSHWSVVRQLIEGNFEYLPHGLLSVGHIRFFTPKSLKGFLEETCFRIEFWKEETPPLSPAGIKFIEKIEKILQSQSFSLKVYRVLFCAQRVG